MSHDEPRKRHTALAILGFMVVIFIVLSGLSFVDSRPQATPDRVSFGKYGAVQGKRVFQAYNCMGCHTVVGNGAYFGPDLTDTYEKAGPAWLAAFLPSAGSWPTAVALGVQLQDSTNAAESKATTVEEYLAAFPGARERIERRGGGSSHMPNLPLTKDEVGALIAFLKYTSAMNTEGWPAKPLVDGLSDRRAAPGRAATAGATPTPGAASGASSATAAPPPAPADSVARGAQLVKDVGCVACHSTGKETLVGPGWGGLYGSTVELADGSRVVADDAYMAESMNTPNARVVAGFTPGLMASYATLLTDEQRGSIIAYIRSLGRK